MRLRSYLTALILSTTAPLVVVTAASSWWVAVEERGKEEAAMKRVAAAAAGAVDGVIGQRLVFAQAMAAAPVLAENGDRAAFETLARRAARRLASTSSPVAGTVYSF